MYDTINLVLRWSENMIETKIVTVDQLASTAQLDEIAKVIETGGIVVFPTETVYGIGANALNPTASEKIYRVKGRPSDNPLIIHIGQVEDMAKYAQNIPPIAWQLAQAFWPGPLTFILQKQDIIPSQTTGGLDTVAIRYPKHDAALKIIRHVGVPLAAPSANLSGRPSSTEFKHVVEDLYGKVNILIDGGPSPIGLESTVLDLTTSKPVILRPGAITKSMLERILGFPVEESTNLEANLLPKSPGMKYTHYKPTGDVIILYGPIQAVAEYVQSQRDDAIPTAVICASDYELLFPKVRVRTIGYLSQPDWIAKQLFSALREMDEWKMKRIFIHSFPEDEIGHAVMNRLLKAAGYHIVILQQKK